jgi:hypothetical protein
MVRTNAARRRRRHRPPVPRPGAARPFDWRLLAAAVLSCVIAISALNIGWRLWDSAEGWWIWLLGGFVALGAGVTIWVYTRPNEVGPHMQWLAGASWFFVPLMSFGIGLGRGHYHLGSAASG